jgi:hypothetical protein
MGNTFKDKQGREWTPSITLGALMGFARETGLTLDQLQNFGQIKVAHIGAAIWHSVEAQACERRVKRADFEASVGVAEARAAATIVMAQVENEFPAAAEEIDGEQEDAGVPLTDPSASAYAS